MFDYYYEMCFVNINIPESPEQYNTPSDITSHDIAAYGGFDSFVLTTFASLSLPEKHDIIKTDRF